MTSVLVCGAGGKMGKEVVKAVMKDTALTLAGAVDVSAAGQKLSTLIPEITSDSVVSGTLTEGLKLFQPDVVVDFTSPKVIFENSQTVLANGTHLVVGTTGLTEVQRGELDQLARAKQVGALIAPNFSLGAILMMSAAEQIAKYLPNVEIIELHHNHKYDAPSGTAKLTAEKIKSARELTAEPDLTKESVPGARGADWEEIRIHSVRLPGYVAHQEVLFGGVGETLTIRHDSLDRSSFMPGVVLACKRVVREIGLTYGLEHYL